MLNRLVEELEEPSPAEMEKLKAAVYLTEPDRTEKLLTLIAKVEQLDDALWPLPTGPSTRRLVYASHSGVFRGRIRSREAGASGRI